MRVRLSTFAIALVLAANAVVLAGVAWNRMGEPSAVLELTEREVAVPYRRWGARESMGVALAIQRTPRSDDWLDRDKLAELGFDVDDGRIRQSRGWRDFERRAYVALEYDGPAFEALLAEENARIETMRADVASGEATRQQLERAQAALRHIANAESRLVAVDASRSAEVLRARYPEPRRYAVMRAIVRMQVFGGRSGEPEQVLRGRVGRLMPARIHVPRRFHDALEQATGERQRDFGQAPRFRAAVKFGRRLEPWLVDIDPMPIDEGGGGSG